MQQQAFEQLTRSAERATIAIAKLASALGDRAYYTVQVEAGELEPQWCDIAGGPLWFIGDAVDRNIKQGRRVRVVPRA